MKLIKPGFVDNGSYAKVKDNEITFREESLSPSKLKPNPNNLFDKLEESDYKRLKEDIKERGIIDPLICDKSFTLLTGHNRLSIAKELKLELIPVRILQTDLSEDDKEKLLVFDNLNRRQLGYEEKKKLIAKYYKDDLQKDNRGGNQSKKDESSSELSLDLSKKIEKQTGIKAGTAKRIVADLRKESKPKEQEKDESSSELSLDDSKLRTLAIRKFDKKEKLSHPEKKVLKSHFKSEIERREKEIAELRKEITDYKKKSNLIDFQKEKSAKDFQKAIKTGELYKELRPKKEKKN